MSQLDKLIEDILRLDPGVKSPVNKAYIAIVADVLRADMEEDLQ